MRIAKKPCRHARSGAPPDFNVAQVPTISDIPVMDGEGFHVLQMGEPLRWVAAITGPDDMDLRAYGYGATPGAAVAAMLAEVRRGAN